MRGASMPNRQLEPQWLSGDPHLYWLIELLGMKAHESTVIL
jgi:hypothetical protein